MSTPELHGYPRTTGHPNGRPEFKPYVRNPAIAAREAEVAAHLAAVRARIQDAFTAVTCPYCDRKFVEDSSLRAHLASAHGVT